MESTYWSEYWRKTASRRGVLRAAGAVGALGALAACAPAPSGGTTSSTQDPTAGVPQIFRHAIGNPPVTLDPNGTALSSSYFYALYDAMTRVDSEAKVLPGLATAWKPVSDTVWEFTLRDAVWSDGSPFTAEDVVFTYNFVLDTKNRSAIASRIANVAGVSAVNARTVRVETKGADPLMPARAFFIPILPKAYIDRIGIQQFGISPIGTGGFKVQDYKQGTRVVMVPSERSWRKPQIKELTLLEMPEASTRLAALRSGDVDAIDTLDRQNAQNIRQDPNFQVVVADGAASYSFDLEYFRAPFSDRRVRQALNFAVDKQTILDKLLLGYGKVMDGQMVPKNVFGYNPNLKPYEFDAKRARDLLVAAGADGLDVPIEFTTVQPEPRLIAEAMFQYFKDVGLKPELKPVETAIWRTHIYEGGRAPVFYNPWSAQAPLDAEFILNWYSAGSFNGKPYWKNDAFEAAYSRSQTELDAAKRLANIQAASAAMREDPPVLFTIQTTTLWGVSRKTRGFVGNPSNYIWYDDISMVKA